MDHIPIHILQEKTDKGLQVSYMDSFDQKSDHSALHAHRDDHYIFFVLETGDVAMMVDFQEVVWAGSSVYYMLPGQVHSLSSYSSAKGWFIAVDASLIPQDCRNVFESQLLLQRPYLLNHNELEQYRSLLRLFVDKYQEDVTLPFHTTIVHALLHSFLSIVAGCYSITSGSSVNLSRPAQLATQFKQLLNQHLQANKSPAAYAALLNVSDAYLTEVLKKQTGFSASYWIQQEVMLEAKRLLYYTELSIKQISAQLGYTDHSYFSRFFSKAAGVSPTAFRQRYRE